MGNRKPQQLSDLSQVTAPLGVFIFNLCKMETREPLRRVMGMS